MPATLNNLPPQPTSFIGRDRELEELDRLFEKTRLLTLTGVGGTGKTRLAVQFAARKRNSFPDGVWFIDLAPIADPNLVTRALAKVFGLREKPGANLTGQLSHHLQDMRALVVIDNCEHVIEKAVSQIRSLLANCPSITVLATSREAFQIRQETIYTVPSLQTPECDGPLTIARAPAVRLFVDRAHTACNSFVLDEENAPAVAAVCRKLDGLPLAIELAAACTRTMSPQKVHLWLNRKFDLLAAESGTTIERHETLRSLIDWSYDLLDESEKTLFDAVSVFRGGWSLELAEKVCTVADIDQADVLDLLSSLVNKSLIVEESGRYNMLETVRDYARDRLAESGDAHAIGCMHAAALLEFAELAGPHLTGPMQVEWLRFVETEYDNIRAALAWMAAHEENSVHALSMCAAIWRFWSSRGYLSEGRRWIDDALSAASETEALPIRVEVLTGAGNLSWLQADYSSAEEHIGKALPQLRAIGEQKGLADALNLLGNVATALGNKTKARFVFEESLEIRREIGDRSGIAGSLNNLGALAIEAGDADLARQFLEECLDIYGAIGDKNGVALSHKFLGTVAEHEGDYDKAHALYFRSLESFKEIGDRQRTAAATAHVATIALKRGDFKNVRSMFEQSMEIHKQVDDVRGQADSLLDLGVVDMWEGKFDAAESRFDESLSTRRSLGDKWGIMSSLYYLGVAALLQGDVGRSRSLLEESLDLRTSACDRRGAVYAALWLGNAALAAGDRDVARCQYESALVTFQQQKDRAGASQALEALGRFYSSLDPSRAVMLCAAAAEEQKRIGSIRPPHERKAIENCLTSARNSIGHDRYDAAWQQGTKMSIDKAIHAALQVPQPS